MATLKDKTAKGIGWGFADNFANIGIQAVIGIVLARILSPDDFGLIGMTAIFISLANSFTDSGFSVALTRKKEATNIDFNTIFYSNIGLGTIFYSILFFSAPFIASFFEREILTSIIRILGLSIVFTAFTTVQKVILIRKIDFKTQAIVSFFSSILSGTIAIIMALSDCGVWTLVVLQLSKLFIASFLFWVLSAWKPQFVFSINCFKEMFSFGSKLLTASIISILWNEVYSLIIGKFYNAPTLGQYSRAEKFKGMVTSNVSIVMQRVSYPVLSNIQDEKERQLRVYRKVIRTTLLLTSTLVCGLAAVADNLVVVLIGDQWTPAVPFIRILCISGLFIPLLLNAVNILNANGRSDLTLRLEIIKTVLAVIPVLLAIYFSIEWMLWGIALVTVINFFIYSLYLLKVINYKISSQIGDILPSLSISIIMALSVWGVGFLDINVIIKLLIQLIIGGAIIFTIYEFLYKNEEYIDIKNALLGLLKKKN